MPPKAAQVPTASTWRARAARSSTQDIMGRPVPDSMWKRPVPWGPVITEPSTQRMSSSSRPSAQAARMSRASVPEAWLRLGCQSRRMPASSRWVKRSGCSALSRDRVQPPQPPDWSQRRLRGLAGMAVLEGMVRVAKSPPAPLYKRGEQNRIDLK